MAAEATLVWMSILATVNVAQWATLFATVYCSSEKCVDVLCRAEISAFLAYLCLNLVAMATPFALLKMLIAYLYPPTTKTLPYTQKVSRYGVQS